MNASPGIGIRRATSEDAAGVGRDIDVIFIERFLKG